MTHRFELRVYYEDTDLMGIVYYANYLRFIERARSEWVRARGVDQGRLREDQGLVLVVRRIEADYLRPARFEDVLVVETELLQLGGASLRLRQTVRRGEQALFVAEVVLVCMALTGGPLRLPQGVRAALEPAPDPAG